MKRAWITLAAFTFAAVASAQSAKYKDWAKSPEAYFLTPAERAEWAQVKSDDEAEKFIATYYARRGGEKFKAEIARRIAAADEQFKLRRQRGAESSRGRLLIVLGGPTRVTATRPAGPDTNNAAVGGESRTDTAFGGTATAPVVTQNWIYEKEKFDPSWGIGDLTVQIAVDPQRGTDEIQNASAANKALGIVAEKSIVAPGAVAATTAATSSPSGAAAAPAAANPASGSTAPGASAAVAATPAPSAPSSAAPVKAVRSLRAAGRHRPGVGAGARCSDGDRRSGDRRNSSRRPCRSRCDAEGEGESEHDGSVLGRAVSHRRGRPVLLAGDLGPGRQGPGPRRPSSAGRHERGRPGGRHLLGGRPLTDVKTGQRNDRVYERSVVLPPGSYRGAFGLFPADGSTALTTSSGRSSS